MSNRSKKAQKIAIEEQLEEMLIWYASASGGKTPSLAVDEKTYGGKVLRWYEPVLPNQQNPVLIEEQLGDNWTLRTEPMKQKIQSIGGI